jgi:hypothetical protein
MPRWAISRSLSFVQDEFQPAVPRGTLPEPGRLTSGAGTMHRIAKRVDGFEQDLCILWPEECGARPGHQQILGSCSPLSMSTTRLPPIRLCRITVRPGLSSTWPTRTDPCDTGIAFMTARAASA